MMRVRSVNWIDYEHIYNTAYYGGNSLVHIKFDFVEIFLWALSGSVIVIETAVLSAQFLDVVIVRPSINLLEWV